MKNILFLSIFFSLSKRRASLIITLCNITFHFKLEYLNANFGYECFSFCYYFYQCLLFQVQKLKFFYSAKKFHPLSTESILYVFRIPSFSFTYKNILVTSNVFNNIWQHLCATYTKQDSSETILLFILILSCIQCSRFINCIMQMICHLLYVTSVCQKGPVYNASRIFGPTLYLCDFHVLI